MSRSWLLVAIAWCLPGLAQENIWANVSTDWENIDRRFAEIVVTESQEKAITKLLKSLPPPWICKDEDPKGEWLNHLIFKPVSLSSKDQVLLVEAGPGCARSGQGANGAMWLIRFDGRNPILLAQLDGFLYSVQEKVSNGYRDVVIGWHNSVFKTYLAYFRFDGKAYRHLGKATLRSDNDGTRIVPD